MALLSQTDSRIANATGTWQQNCNVDVTGWDTANEFILACYALATTVNPDGDAKLQWRRAAGTFADVTATTEICWGTATSLVNGNLVANTAGCLTTVDDSQESEGDNIVSALNVKNGDYFEAQWALGFGSGAQDNQEYELQIVGTSLDWIDSAILQTTITTAAGQTETIFDRDFELIVQLEAIVDRDFELNVTANQVETIFDRDFELIVQTEAIVDRDFELIVQTESIIDRDFELNVDALDITDRDFELIVQTESIVDRDFELNVLSYTIFDRDFELIVQTESITDRDFELNVLGVTETIFDRDFELIVQTESIIDRDFELIVQTEAIVDRDFELNVQTETIFDRDFELIVQLEAIVDRDFELGVDALTIFDRDFELLVQTETITDRDFELNVLGITETITDRDFELIVQTESIFDRAFELIVQTEAITDRDFELIVQTESITDRDFELNVTANEVETIFDRDFELNVFSYTIFDRDFELIVQTESIVDRDFELGVDALTIFDRNFYITVQTESITDRDFELNVEVLSETIFDRDFELNVESLTIFDRDFELNVTGQEINLPIITLREASDPYDELTGLDFGNISAEGTSSPLNFRVYNNFNTYSNIWAIKDFKVGLSLFNMTEVITVLRKELETDIVTKGIFQIKCVWSAEIEANPAVDWEELKMEFDDFGNIIGYYSDVEFDYIPSIAPNNYNEYQIRLVNFPDLDVLKEEYTIQMTVGWEVDKEEEEVI